MARTTDPHSATSQFYINVANNTFLDFVEPSTWGYAVFGEVIDGMDVVTAIEGVTTGAGGPFTQDVPQDMIVISDVQIL
jgi:cyclophilin family peptidyl-prolyl cis-trans isomerase